MSRKKNERKTKNADENAAKIKNKNPKNEAAKRKSRTAEGENIKCAAKNEKISGPKKESKTRKKAKEPGAETRSLLEIEEFLKGFETPEKETEKTRGKKETPKEAAAELDSFEALLLKEHEERKKKKREKEEKYKEARRKREKRAKIAVGTVTAAAVVFVIGGAAIFGDSENGKKLFASENTSVLKFTALGDNFITEKVYEQAAEDAQSASSSEGEEESEQSEYDFSPVYGNIKSLFADSELVMANAETLITNDIEPADYPYFSTPSEAGDALLDIGVNVITLSNNHVYDYEAKGLTSTLAYWGETGALVSGLWTTDSSAETSFTDGYAENGKTAQDEVDYTDIPIYEEQEGLSVAVLSYTDAMNSSEERDDAKSAPKKAKNRVIFLYEEELIKAQVEYAQQNADVVIVSCHWGKEDSTEVSSRQRRLAQFLADSGADLIIGTGPHVIQEAEFLKSEDGRDVFCAYSLGNLVSTQESPENLLGAALSCSISLSEPKGYDEYIAGIRGEDAGEAADEEEEEAESASAEEEEEGFDQVYVYDIEMEPLVTHYNKKGKNISVYALSGYTDDLLSEHGIAVYTDSFTFTWMEEFLTEQIGKFLPEGVFDD